MMQVLRVIFKFNVTLCVQCRYNLSELEEWLRSSRIYDKAMETTLEPLVQVAQLLQVKKRNEDDVDIICDTCTQLTVTQVINNNGLRPKKKKLLCCPLLTDRKMRKNRVVFFFFFFFFFYYVRFGRRIC